MMGAAFLIYLPVNLITVRIRYSRKWIRVAVIVSFFVFVALLVLFLPVSVSPFVWLGSYIFAQSLMMKEHRRFLEYALINSILSSLSVLVFLNLGEKMVSRELVDLEDFLASSFLRGVSSDLMFFVREFWVRQRELLASLVGFAVWFVSSKDEKYVPDAFSVYAFLILIPVSWVLTFTKSILAVEVAVSIDTFLMFRLALSGMYIISFLIRKVPGVLRWVILLLPFAIHTRLSFPIVALYSGVSIMHYWVFLRVKNANPS